MRIAFRGESGHASQRRQRRAAVHVKHFMTHTVQTAFDCLGTESPSVPQTPSLPTGQKSSPVFLNSESQSCFITPLRPTPRTGHRAPKRGLSVLRQAVGHCLAARHDSRMTQLRSGMPLIRERGWQPDSEGYPPWLAAEPIAPRAQPGRERRHLG